MTKKLAVYGFISIYSDLVVDLQVSNSRVTNGTTAAVVAVAISLGFVFVAVINKYVSKLQKVKK